MMGNDGVVRIFAVLVRHDPTTAIWDETIWILDIVEA